MKEGEDYIITGDPQGNGQDDWVVVLSDPFDRLVGRYRNIEITNKGTEVSYKFERLFCPEECVIEGREDELSSRLSDILVNILREHHDKRANIYYNMETKERIEYE